MPVAGAGHASRRGVGILYSRAAGWLDFFAQIYVIAMIFRAARLLRYIRD
jgi:hypothetical protein